jgi:hypothetical protein
MALLGSATSKRAVPPYDSLPIPHHVGVQEAPYRTIAFLVPTHPPLVRSAKQLPSVLPPARNCSEGYTSLGCGSWSLGGESNS